MSDVPGLGIFADSGWRVSNQRVEDSSRSFSTPRRHAGNVYPRRGGAGANQDTAMLLWKVARHLLAIAGIVLLGGLISATLVRVAPGFDTDERQLDPGLNAESIRALRA